jgi:hypothetical protein
MSRYRLLLLFLALFSRVGIGQRLSRVRALDDAAVFTETQQANDQPQRCWDHRHIIAVNAHHERNSELDWERRKVDNAHYITQPHDIHFASARARRQDPRVLTTAEGSANT